MHTVIHFATLLGFEVLASYALSTMTFHPDEKVIRVSATVSETEQVKHILLCIGTEMVSRTPSSDNSFGADRMLRAEAWAESAYEWIRAQETAAVA